MLGDPGRETRQFGIRRKRNPLYVPLMIADESHVAKEAPQILPTGKFAGMNHQSLEAAMRFDPGVCSECQRIEILCAQGLFDFHHDHTGVRQKTMRNGRAFGKRAQPVNGLSKLFVAEYATRDMA